MLKVVWFAMGAVLAVAACSDDPDRTSPTVTETVVASSAGTPPAPDLSVLASPILSQLRGDALGTTRLSLLGDGTVVDADSGARQAIRGLPSLGDVHWADRIDGGVIITIDCIDCAERPQVFFLQDGESAAEHVVGEAFVTPGFEGLWAKTFTTDTSCQLSRIDLTGRVIQQAQPIDCRLGIVEETSLGLVAFLDTAWVLLDKSDLDETRRWSAPSRLAAVVGQSMLIDDTKTYTLVDTTTGDQTTVAAPDAVGHPSYGIVSPDGRYVAFEYRQPEQIMDLWVLDLQLMRWIHAPSMPVYSTIKRPGPTWTPDGRLAVLSYFGQSPAATYLLVVWQPGDSNLSYRRADEEAWFIL